MDTRNSNSYDPTNDPADKMMQKYLDIIIPQIQTIAENTPPEMDRRTITKQATIYMATRSLTRELITATGPTSTIVSIIAVSYNALRRMEFSEAEALDFISWNWTSDMISKEIAAAMKAE